MSGGVYGGGTGMGSGGGDGGGGTGNGAVGRGGGGGGGPGVTVGVPSPPPLQDEVGALVFDIGSFSVRAGYAGEDCPKVWGRPPHRDPPPTL